MVDAYDPDEVDSINRALLVWRQGDVALSEKWFVHVASPATAREADPEYDEDVPTPLQTSDGVEGLVVVTQTCDIVRTVAEREYLEVCPLVKVMPSQLNEIKAQRRPGYAYIPNVSTEQLVADLDRVMTVEKRLAASWQRTQGWENDEEARHIAFALSRKRARFAFPDDFVQLVRPLQARITSKHNRKSSEGHALQALREIRVQAAPSWESNNVSLFFHFIRESESGDGEESWSNHLEAWRSLIKRQGRFTKIEGHITTLERMTAHDYVTSDILDLSHLSNS